MVDIIQLGIITSKVNDRQELSSEKAMTPHSGTLAGKSQGWRSLVGCSPWGR